ncbi:alpha-beta hydrolase superfamily lysophospholipase [Nitrosomonas nitrosa]|uniref:alpha/beta hydrolase n=1 Tax=Nitrosomonas nitrosa TaxID=52442 RepID=UPI000D2F9B66|nr:hypothetical protein [Nitrosomonas nitrosa]PTR00675.1 alpha-beta hydrolase superfamily lysophospholipase [Nitrosomonas nitrosa]
MSILADYVTQVERYEPHLTHLTERTLRADTPQIYFFTSSDGVSLRLKRYRGGNKGPVILSHCIGVSSLMYSLTTIETNLLEYLFERSYDVWLLDHRLSIELPASGQLSTMDDVALKDYPAAVRKVCELTGRSSVQIVGHGVGASTLTMALLGGLQQVSAAVCSQVSTHLYSLPINEFKARMFMPRILQLLGKHWLTAYTDIHAGISTRLYDAALMLHPIPRHERCANAVCHRITTLFGELYEHTQLNQATHDTLARLFGRVNIAAMKQLTSILLQQHLIDARGKDTYLPHLDRLKLPMTFLSGGRNDCVLPKSTQKTFDLLVDANGAQFYKRFELTHYGHVDCIIGQNAAQDVYPLILDRLETA